MRDVRDNSSYLLAELDGTKLPDAVAGNHLKEFSYKAKKTVGEQRDEDGTSRTSSGLEDMRYEEFEGGLEEFP